MKALYARQSVDKKDSFSVESQIEECKTKLLRNEEYLEYTDKGFSGKNTERPSLNLLLQDIEHNKIDGVIVYKLDRFSRNITDFFNMYEIMKEHNCEFVSVSEGFDTRTSMGRGMMGILAVFAQMERENIQQRVKDNYYYRVAQDGRWAGGPAPYGFKNAKTEDNKPTLVADEEQQFTIKNIFYRYVEQVSVSLGIIAKDLREANIICNKSGKATWTSSSVAKILQNTVYVKADELLYSYLELKQIKFLNDKSAWNGEHSAHIIGKKVGNGNVRKYTDFKEQSVYLTNFPGFIDSELYIRAMERLEKNEQIKNTTRQGVLMELGGKLKCQCGYAIKAYSKSTNGRPYLDCYANRTLHICSHKYNTFNFYEIQEEVGKQIQEKIHESKQIVYTKMRAKEKKKKEIAELEGKLDKLLDIFIQSPELEQATTRRIEDIQKNINQLRFELVLNEDVLDILNVPEIRRNFKGSFSNINYSTLSTEEKKYVVGAYIDKIVLNEETEAIEIFWKI